MRRHHRTAMAATRLAAAVALVVSACSSGQLSPAAPSSGAEPSASLVGTGCADYARRVPTGPGSLAGMAQDPVATATASNPLLTTLAAALSGKLNPAVNLVESLDGGQFTVFAPVDGAFAKLDPATLDALKSDAPRLNAILTYHVVPGQLDPEQVAGVHPTLQGGSLVATRSGETINVDGATVICGGMRTANATVYLIDSVLTPRPTGLHPDAWRATDAPHAFTAAHGSTTTPESGG